MTITLLSGNILNDPSQTLVNTVNCVGVMGKGIALEFKRHYPDMFRDYQKRCKNKEVHPGVPYLYIDFFGNSIINFPTKNHWRYPSRIEYIEKGLDVILKNYHQWDVTSLALPALGCGNGGLNWAEVKPLMFRKLSSLEIPVIIYSPFGTF